MIHFETRITLKDFQEFNLTVYKQRWSFKMMQLVSFAFIVLFFTMSYFSIQSKTHLEWSTYGILLFALIYLFAIPWLLKYNAKKSYLANPVLQETIHYEIDQREIRMSAKSYESKFKWNDVYRITENETGIFVYINKQAANLLPKRDLTDSQLQEIKKIIKSKKGFSIKLEP